MKAVGKCCICLIAITSLTYAASMSAQKSQVSNSSPTTSSDTDSFNRTADRALEVMMQQANKQGIKGVALIAYFDGEEIQSWQSKMIVIGKRKDPPDAVSPGANLLAIAYAKAAEAADTLKPSGSAGRTLMTGEYGWSGSVIRKAKHGYWIAAFSGGKSEDDVNVSNRGLDAILQSH